MSYVSYVYICTSVILIIIWLQFFLTLSNLKSSPHSFLDRLIASASTSTSISRLSDEMYKNSEGSMC